MQQTRRASLPFTSVIALIAGILMVVVGELVLDGPAGASEAWHWIQHGVFFLGGLTAGSGAMHLYLSEPR